MSASPARIASAGERLSLTAVAAGVAAFALAALVSTAALAQPATIAGVWWAPDRDAKIEIVIDQAGTANGRLVAVASDAPVADTKNANPALRDRPVLGLTIIRDFRQQNDGSWSGGTVYDPETGGTYRGTLSLDGSDRLRMRGYVGIPLLGRTEILTRVGGPNPAGPQLGEPALRYLPR
jgi:uncharacterized protein (DUF2147 family)